MSHQGADAPRSPRDSEQPKVAVRGNEPCVFDEPTRRRGIILLVVLVMLTLFAIAGLTFVLYAEAASESARINSDAETYAVSNAPDMDPTQSLNLFLGQLIYGVADPTAANTNSGSSALRGHSLAETMYGSYDSNGTAPYVPSDVPYNGTGRLSEPGLYSGTDGNQLVNYMYFKATSPVTIPPSSATRRAPARGPTPAPPARRTPAAKTRRTPIPIRIVCSWRRSAHPPAR